MKNYSKMLKNQIRARVNNNTTKLFALPQLHGCDSEMSLGELTEKGGVGEFETVADLLDAEVGLTQAVTLARVHWYR